VKAHEKSSRYQEVETNNRLENMMPEKYTFIAILQNDLLLGKNTPSIEPIRFNAPLALTKKTRSIKKMITSIDSSAYKLSTLKSSRAFNTLYIAPKDIF
jgi:hypothetical protein